VSAGVDATAVERRPHESKQVTPNVGSPTTGEVRVNGRLRSSHLIARRRPPLELVRAPMCGRADPAPLDRGHTALVLGRVGSFAGVSWVVDWLQIE